MSETIATETSEAPPEASATTGTKASRSRKTVKRPPEASPAELAAFVKAQIPATTASVVAFATLLKMQPSVVAAVKVERGWDDNTLVTEQDLRNAVDAWLKAPASAQASVGKPLNQKGK